MCCEKKDCVITRAGISKLKPLKTDFKIKNKRVMMYRCRYNGLQSTNTLSLECTKEMSHCRRQ